MRTDRTAQGTWSRVAVVHDWLYTIGGAERVLAGLLRCLPGADVYALFDVLSPEDRHRIGYEQSHTSFLQRMPGIKGHHRAYLPLMPIAIEQLDLSGYDLVVSSSFAVAKGVLTGPDQLHISYVHSPMRYAWDLQHQYLRESGLQRGVKSVLARAVLHGTRIWDVRTAHGVDAYVTNSHFVARRIRKIYGHDAEVIYPPVAVPSSLRRVTKDRFFIAASRLVPYKNMHLIVEAFRLLPQEQLLVVGAGPELHRLQALSGPNVTLLGHVPDAELHRLLAVSRALIFAAEEDFGIVMAEAHGQGTPVIALGRGGAREIVMIDGPAPTGLFFEEASPRAIAAAVHRFVVEEHRFLPQNCHRNALRFGTERFDATFAAYVRTCCATFEVGYPMLDDAAD